jgi:hypothetical protein
LIGGKLPVAKEGWLLTLWSSSFCNLCSPSLLLLRAKQIVTTLLFSLCNCYESACGWTVIVRALFKKDLTGTMNPILFWVLGVTETSLPPNQHNKVKFSLSLIKHHAMKMHVGVKF